MGPDVTIPVGSPTPIKEEMRLIATETRRGGILSRTIPEARGTRHLRPPWTIRAATIIPMLVANAAAGAEGEDRESYHHEAALAVRIAQASEDGRRNECGDQERCHHPGRRGL